MRSAHMGLHTDDNSSLEHRGGVVRHWLRSNRRFGSSTTFARLARHDSTASSDRLTERTCGVQTKRPCRMKHIELKMLTVQEWLKTGRLRIHKVSTHDNPADLLNKAMTREKLIKFGRALNLRGSFTIDLGQPAQQHQLHQPQKLLQS